MRVFNWHDTFLLKLLFKSWILDGHPRISAWKIDKNYTIDMCLKKLANYIVLHMKIESTMFESIKYTQNVFASLHNVSDLNKKK